MTSPTAVTGLSPLGKAFFGSLCAGTFGLGCWQTQRFFEKQELVAQREHDLALDPEPLTSDYNTLSLRRKVVEGIYRHDKEVLVGPRGPPPGAMASSGPSSGRNEGGMSSSPQGYFVITPLVRDDGTTVLINRGWIPRHFVQSKQLWERPTGEVQVIGVPAKTERPRNITPQHDFTKWPPQLFWMDQATLQQNAGVDKAAMLTQVRTLTEHKFPVQPPLETVGEFKTTPMIHAGYAFTWFGLAGAGVVMTRKLITRGR